MTMDAHSNPAESDRSLALNALFEVLAAALDQVDPMLSFDEACTAISCGPIKLRSLLAVGQLPGLKLGKEWVIPRRAFFQRLNELALSEMSGRAAEEEERNLPVVQLMPTAPLGMGIPVGMNCGKRGRPRGSTKRNGR